MSNSIISDNQYQYFIQELKAKIQSSSQKAVRAVNSELIHLYFEIGKDITEKQSQANWGDNFISQIEKDLRLEFPKMKGFSRRNLFYMRSLYLFCMENQIVQQVVAQIPWGHLIMIIEKIKNRDEALFYIQKTIENGWSRVILDHQIDSDLYLRAGKSLNNFDITLVTEAQAEMAKAEFKESYVLDFLGLGEGEKERQIEARLVSNAVRFMTELGKGFAYVGRQHKLNVGSKEFFIDLLFFNYNLNRFVVVELKTSDFKPEYLGQLNFYMTAVNRDVKKLEHGDTIGLLICKGVDKTVVEYSLSGSKQPTVVASYQLPKELQNELPNEQEIIHGLNYILNADSEEAEVDSE